MKGRGVCRAHRGSLGPRPVRVQLGLRGRSPHPEGPNLCPRPQPAKSELQPKPGAGEAGLWDRVGGSALKGRKSVVGIGEEAGNPALPQDCLRALI